MALDRQQLSEISESAKLLATESERLGKTLLDSMSHTKFARLWQP